VIRKYHESNLISASWAAAGKWAVRESGDAIVVVQLGSGRVVGLIVDVQGSGSGAGYTAWSLTTLGSHLAGEGADALSSASMLNRALWTRRGGRVQAGLGVALWDPGQGLSFATYGSVLVATPPAFERRQGDASPPAGLDRTALPVGGAVSDEPASLVMCSDGIAATMEDLFAVLERQSDSPTASAILARAVARDRGRPRNDMSVIVMTTSASDQPGPSISGELRAAQRPAPSRGRVADVAEPAP